MERIWQHYQKIIVLTLSGLFLLSAIWEFERTITLQVREQTVRLVEQTAQYQQQEVKDNFERQLGILETVAEQGKLLSGWRQEQVHNFLQQIVELSTFSDIGIVDRDGSVQAATGTVQVGGSEYIQAILQSEKNQFEPVIERIDDVEIIISAVPMYEGGTITGLIYGVNSVAELAMNIESLAFKEATHSYLLDQEGHIIGGVNEIELALGENIFLALQAIGLTEDELAKLQTDFKMKTTGHFTYNEGDGEGLAYYTPLGIKDWTLFMVVPNSQIQPTIAQTAQAMIGLSLKIMLVFIGLLVYVLSMSAKAKRALQQQLEATKLNELKYKLVFEQAEAIIFEYDILTEELQLASQATKEFQTLVGNSGPYTPQFFVAHKLVVGQTCYEFLQLFIKIQQGQALTALTFESRMPDGTLRWYSVNMTTLFDERGVPKGAIGKLQNVTQLREQTQRFMQAAQRDSLTGLYNKKTTQMFVTEALRKNQAHQALLLIDIDNFKQVNDQYGHMTGDHVIQAVAQALKETSTESEIIGRIGGDEFLACWQAVMSRQQLEQRLRDLQQRLQQTQYPFSVSIGVVCLNQTCKQSFQTCYHQADQAMYEAKLKGKNQWSIYRPE